MRGSPFELIVLSGSYFESGMLSNLGVGWSLLKDLVNQFGEGARKTP